MPSQKSSLEKFLENYLNNKKITNKEDSFEDYKRKNLPDYDAEYAKEAESAYVNALLSRANYGATAEKLHSMGLGGSGYMARQSELSNDKYEKALERLMGKRRESEESARRSYSDYLESYRNKESSLMKSVRGELIKNGIINTERAYAYALGAGLSDEKARELSLGVYSALRDKVIADLLDRVITYRLDPASASRLAEEYGLNDTDREYVRSEAEKQRGKGYTPSNSELSALEREADRTTGSK